MKKLIIIAAALLLSYGAATAGNGAHVQELITKKIKMPSELKSQKLNEKVNVQFSISSNGNVSSVDVNTTNPELKNYVKEQIKAIDFSTVKESKEMTYFVNISFRVL